jgi:putative glycosyl hydrolase-like family 15 (GHL15) protein
MRKVRVVVRCACWASVAACTLAAPAQAQDAGRVQFVKAAPSSFDSYTSAPASGQQSWMRSHYWRMRTYSPYFDSRLSWFPNAWVYQDLYGIYTDSSVASQHPDWILKDSRGNKLYIPFGCAGGTCPQYAGDFGNASFRSWWLSAAAAKLAKGYRGLLIDDVNMDWRVSNGYGQFVVPNDPRTGTTMTESNWRRYMAEVLEQARSRFPTQEIVHNVLWWAGCSSPSSTCWSDPYIVRQYKAANYAHFERGVNDAGLRGGTGRFGYETLMARIDWLHGLGRGFVFDAGASSDADREYGLASFLLANSGADGMGNDPRGTPDDWWTGYDVNLGPATGPRYVWKGLLRRNFQSGIVLVNEPDAATNTQLLDSVYTDLNGLPHATVTLGPAAGIVLRRLLP